MSYEFKILEYTDEEHQELFDGNQVDFPFELKLIRHFKKTMGTRRHPVSSYTYHSLWSDNDKGKMFILDWGVPYNIEGSRYDLSGYCAIEVNMGLLKQLINGEINIWKLKQLSGEIYGGTWFINVSDKSDYGKLPITDSYRIPSNIYPRNRWVCDSHLPVSGDFMSIMHRETSPFDFDAGQKAEWWKDFQKKKREILINSVIN